MTQSNNLIKLKNVRLSYPSIFRPKIWDEGKEPKFEATFILDKKDHAAEIKQIKTRMAEVMTAAKINPQRVQPTHICLKDGDTAGKDEYAGKFTLKATNKYRFPIVGKDAVTPIVEEDNIIYGGCYVNSYVNIYPYGNKAVGIAANLMSIQFVKDGEPFGHIPQNIEGAYDPIEWLDSENNQDNNIDDDLPF